MNGLVKILFHAIAIFFILSGVGNLFFDLAPSQLSADGEFSVGFLSVIVAAFICLGTQIKE